jgi:hypothetical protein
VARQLFDEILEWSLELLGGNHPYTLTAMYWLSSIMRKLGRRRSASDLLRERAEKSERHVGPCDTATVERYERLREWEAEDGVRRVFRRTKEVSK